MGALGRHKACPYVNSLYSSRTFGHGAAGHRPLRTGAVQAAGAGVGEEKGRLPAHQPQHLPRHRPDLPLGPAAAAQLEKVLQLPGIHGHHDLGRGGIGKHETGVLGRDSGIEQLPVDAVDLVEQASYCLRSSGRPAIDGGVTASKRSLWET